MFRSIRIQILLPIVAIQGLAVASITLATAGLATRRAERQILDRIAGVAGTLDQASFPLTPSVLARMRDLSGADLVVHDGEGRVAATTIPGLSSPLPRPSLAGSSRRLDSLAGAPDLILGGTRYFARSIRAADRAGGPSVLILYPEASWRLARREAAAPPLLVGLGSLGLTAAVTGWIARRISGRLRAVERQVARIAAGEFLELEAGGRGDEVRDLSRSINHMCSQLREMRGTIRRSERARLLAQLGAGLAHQLRNSIAGARMSVQLHARRCPAREGDRSLEVALRQLTLTEEQVRGLLSLGRVERREPSRCDVGDMLDEVALLVGPSYGHAGVGLRWGRPDRPIAVLADESALRASILNLALNANEAAGRNGEVGLGASSEGGEVTIEVSDTGPGPAPALAESLFDPFVTGKPEGVGLGLALARQVAVEHGGRVSWTREDGRTRFRLVLPEAEAP